MKPTVQLAATSTPDGKPVALYEHDGDYTISVDRAQLMSSREHASELELARLGCARVAAHRAPVVLIGGLGMGYTLRQALDMLPAMASIAVAELIPDVVRWNRDIIGHLNAHPLRDRRVTVHVGNVLDILRRAPNRFDAILLDIDNGPEAFTTAANRKIYTPAGIDVCVRALHAKGSLAIWSVSKDKRFENLLRRQNLHLKVFPVAARKGAKRFSRRIWVASRDPHSLSVLESCVEVPGGGTNL